MELYSGDFALPWKTHSHDNKPLTRQDVKVIDINGDKLPDLVTLHNALNGICVYQHQGDFYNPSKTKLLFGSKNQPTPNPSQNMSAECEGYGQFIQLTGLPYHHNALEATWFVDVNGDRMVDFVSFGDRNDELKIWLSFGDLTVLDKPMTLSLAQNLSTGTTDKSCSRVADIDGDGQTEIILFQNQQATVIDFNRTTTQQLIKANLLTAVYLDNGLRYDIRYGTSTDELLRDLRATTRDCPYELEKIYSVYTHTNTNRALQNLSIVVNQNGSANQIIDHIGTTDYGHINRSCTFKYNWKDELIQATRYQQKLKYAYLPSGSFTLNQEFSPQPLFYPSNPATTLIPASTPENLYQFDNFGQLKSSPKILETRFDTFGQLIYVKTVNQEIYGRISIFPLLNYKDCILKGIGMWDY